MSRKERKNMIDYIEMKKGLDRDQLLYMTDEEIEHIYETIYSLEEQQLAE